LNVQYITDDTGKITGVFIPISDCYGLKSRFEDSNEESTIPEFHKEIVRKRVREYDNNPLLGLDFDEVMVELKNE